MFKSSKYLNDIANAPRSGSLFQPNGNALGKKHKTFHFCALKGQLIHSTNIAYQKQLNIPLRDFYCLKLDIPHVKLPFQGAPYFLSILPQGLAIGLD